MALTIPTVTAEKKQQMKLVFEAQKQENVSQILEAIMNCLSQNKDLTFQDIEAGLRQEKARTYICAQTPREGARVEWPYGTQKTYEVYLRFSENGAISYEAGAYDKNFSRLADCGFNILPFNSHHQHLSVHKSSSKKSSCCIIA